MTSIPRRPLGATGLAVSVLGYGGAPIGFADPARAAEWVPLLHQALEAGINFFDTAPDYRRSEEWLGTALRGRRDRVVIASKCGRVQVLAGEGWAGQEDWSTAGVTAQIEGSLRRLGTDYLDLVQLHSPPDWALADGEAMCGLQAAQAAGKVRHIGVSADGDTAWRALDLDSFATLQISYSILQQAPGWDILPAAVARGLGLIIKQPVANGIPDLPERPGHPDWAGKWEIAQRMDWPALGASGGRLALALRWVLANPLVSTAIVGTTHPAHLAANVAAALAPPLSDDEWRQIAAAYSHAQEQMQREQEQQ